VKTILVEETKDSYELCATAFTNIVALRTFQPLTTQVDSELNQIWNTIKSHCDVIMTQVAADFRARKFKGLHRTICRAELVDECLLRKVSSRYSFMSQVVTLFDGEFSVLIQRKPIGNEFMWDYVKVILTLKEFVSEISHFRNPGSCSKLYLFLSRLPPKCRGEYVEDISGSL
jgi:hypothetical protein